MEKKIEYIIVPGLDMSWHIIPKGKEEDWNTWCKVTSGKHNFLEYDYKGKHPSYSKKIEGKLSSVTFKEFKIN